MTTVACWMCNQEYEPDPAEVDAWERSGEDFDPLDWECDKCRAAQEAIERQEEEYEFGYDPADWEHVGEPVIVWTGNPIRWAKLLVEKLDHRIYRWWVNSRCWCCHRPYCWPFDHKDCIPF